ncbi:MAG TPA: hypothetical protein VNB24_08545 [Acidimicrobiales bacterium]|nr:hypothetical protein [Acidimicrobiales bacterium]
MRTIITDMPIELQVDGIETRGWESGELLARYIQLPPGVDFTPLFKGLPGDLCQSAHWGYILEGSIRVRFADGTEELNSAGDVYYWPAGHTGWTEDGVTFLEWSPTADIQPVLEHIAAQMAAAS